jgi:hypothetical protein
MQRKQPQQKRPRQRLSKGNLLCAPEEWTGPGSLRVEESLDVILLNGLDERDRRGAALFVAARAVRGEGVREDL